MFAVKLGCFTEKISALLQKIAVGGFVRHTVDRIGKDKPCGRGVKIGALFCFIAPAYDFRRCLNGTVLRKVS